jgi:hypothetical protein
VLRFLTLLVVATIEVRDVVVQLVVKLLPGGTSLDDVTSISGVLILEFIPS